jgi:hypothetical protein
VATILWCNEEVSLIKENIDCSLSVLSKLLLSKGYDRSYEAIRKQKRSIIRGKKEKVLEREFEGLKGTYETVLLVPDAHVTTGDDLLRFKCLSRFILDRKPSTILLGGDFADMLCLNSFDSNLKAAIEGRKYKLEVDTVNLALDELLSFKKKDKSYNPRLVFIEGNHCNRISRYIEQNPTLEGIIGVKESFRLEERGFEFIPYKKFINIQDVLFTHVPLNNAGQPISSKFAVHKVGEVTSKSMVFFHSHTVALASTFRHGDKEPIQIFNGGCFFENQEPGHYADDNPRANEKCISILTIYKPGRFDIEQISLERLKEQYR